jgi:oxygen-dependent protoporphyrinogen oxidase
LDNTGIESVTVTGSLAGVAMNGKLLLRGRPETYPFRIPMSWASRAATLKAGARVAAAVRRYARIIEQRPGEDTATRQQRIYDFMNDCSFADYIGELPGDAEALFMPTVTRSAGDMSQISAGSGVGYFSLVWNIGGGLSQSIIGGPSTLTEGIAAALSDRVQLHATVEEIVHHRDSVVVRYRHDEIDKEVRARYVVLATPATISHRVAVDLDHDVRAALSQIAYGPHVSAAFLTNETDPQMWDDAYAIATPQRSFAVVLNLSNVARAVESQRRAGSSIMTFSPASLGRQLLDRDDEEILRRYVDDLEQLFPGFAATVVEASVARWPTGSPYCFPGRAKLQPALMRRSGRVFLAGDYLGTFYTETAIATGLSAAHEVQSLLASDRQTTPHPQPPLRAIS